MMKPLLPFVLALSVLPTLTSWAITPKQTLVIAQALDDVSSFDPAEGFSLTPVQAFNSLYQRLLQSDPADPLHLQPVLASQWQAGSDGHSLVFTLKSGATFANGDPLRPEDVIFSLFRVVKLNLEPAFILTQLGWNAENIGQFLQKTADNQVKISWSAKVSPSFVLSLLSAPVASIINQKQALAHQQQQDLGHQWLNSHSAGTGPYQITRYIAREALLLEANRRAIGGAPRLAHILIKNVPDPATRRLLLEQGDVDMARNLGVDQIVALNNKPGVKTLAVPIASLYYLMFNTAGSEQLSHPALWQAARYLFDYQGITRDLLKGQFSIHQAFVPEGYPGALNDTPFKFDPEKAKHILQQAGLKKVTFKLIVNNQPPYLDIAQALQASFAKGGIRIELLPSISSEVSAKTKSRQFQAVLTSWGPDYFDPNSNAAAFAYHPNDGSKTLAWTAGWSIPQLTQQTLAAVAETNPNRRSALYQKMQQQVQTESPYVIGLQAHQMLAIRDNIQGYRQGVNPDMVFYNQVSK